ncbi:major facilitator superfamily domain-containing protein 6-like [Diadema antillarum]|uniref:major facilitator superfamily domain-containing protein 6-like n=1 Tax=Diadema antillarum TaxID=105358 RepID=UPI003A88A7BC
MTKMACRINREFLPIKMVYFSYLGAFACMLPFISVFFIHIGLTVWQVGLLRSLEPILTFIFSPLWGTLADRYSKHRLATTVAIAGAGILYFTFLFVPAMTGVHPDSLVADVARECPLQAGIEDQGLVCANELSNDHLMHRRSIRGDARNTTNSSSTAECTELCEAGKEARRSVRDGNLVICFGQDEEVACHKCAGTSVEDTADGALIVFSVVCPSGNGRDSDGYSANFSDSNTGTSSPALVPDHLLTNVSNSCQQLACCQCVRENLPNPRKGATFAICIFLGILAVSFNCNILMFFDAFTMELLKDRRKDYGKHRVWGAVSWGLFAFLGGVAVDVYTDLTGAKTDRFEPAFVIYLVGMTICGLIVYNMRLPEHRKPDAMKKNLQSLLCKGEIILFLFIVVVTGMSFVMTFTYVFIFMKTDLKSPYLLLGLAVTLTAIAEIPFMYFSGNIIKRAGYSGVMYITLIAYVIRYFGYSLVRNPWFILPVQLLHGVTYGLAWPMFTAFANTVAPKGMAATLQSIVACSFMGIGAGIGNFIGGMIYHKHGARVLFRCVGSMCIVALVIYFSFTQCLLRGKRSGAQKEEEEEEEEEVGEEVEVGSRDKELERGGGGGGGDEEKGDRGKEGEERDSKKKDVPIDAVNWTDAERTEKKTKEEEEEEMVFTTGLQMKSETTSHNDTNAVIHSANV